MGFASGVVSGEDDNGTNCEPTLAGAGCACNAIGVIGKVTAGDACGVTACDPGVPGDCDSGFASGEAAVLQRADELDALQAEPERRSLYWTLGIDREFAIEAHRRTELSNFLKWLG